MLRRIGAGALATVAAGLVCAAPANAFWAETGNYRQGAIGRVTIDATPGERNDLRVWSVPGPTTVGSMANLVLPGSSVMVHDAGAMVTPPPDGRGVGCTAVDAHTLTCTRDDVYAASGISEVDANLGDGDDRLSIPALSSPLSLVAAGGSGNDTIAAYDLAGGSVNGDDGNDRVTIRGSGEGAFFVWGVQGGAGNDVLDLANGYDNHPTCGDGYDLLYADPGETSPDCEEIQTKTLQVGPVGVP